MTDLDRALTLPFAWFPPDTRLFDRDLRSLSLCSHQAVKVMGLRVLDPLAVYEDPLDEIREVLVYVWLHTADVAELSRALWDGGWREAMTYEESSPAATLALLSEWRAHRSQILALIAATEVRIRTKPRDPKLGPDDTPPDVVNPTLLSAQIVTVAETLGESLDHVKWHVPLWEAWQIYHVDRRREGRWTIPGRDRSVPEETFEDFNLAALTPEPGQDE
jgi:hypothetical protein